MGEPIKVLAIDGGGIRGVIPALVLAEIERRIPWFFKRRHAREHGGDWGLPMARIARATSAAPTYFEPLRVETADGADYYAQARGVHAAVNGFLVVSLGTGGLTRPLPHGEATGWGLLQWALPILGVVFDGAAGTVDYQLASLLPTAGPARRYDRFQARLNERNDDMDDAGRTNLRALRLLAEGIVRQQGDDRDQLCEPLVAA